MQTTLRKVNVFAKWPEERLEELRKDAREIHAAAGKTVVRQGQAVKGIYVIVTGSLEVNAAQRDGRHYIRRYAQPGTAFGFMGIFDEAGSPYSYIAHEPTRMLFIDKAAFIGMLLRFPELWLSVAHHLANFQHVALEVVEEQIFESLQVRLARVLLSLAKAYGARDGRGPEIRVKLTQESLGALLGVTRQSIGKELKRLAKEASIRIEYGEIVLTDPKVLERIARNPRVIRA